MRAILFIGMLSMISIVIFGPIVLIYDLNIFWLVLNMIVCIGTILLYAYVWFGILKNMKNTKDHIFIKKMNRKNMW